MLHTNFRCVNIVYRPFLTIEWLYPDNIKLIPSGKRIKVIDQEQSPLHKKVFFFLVFTKKLLSELTHKTDHWLLLYDGMPTLSLYLIWPFLKNKPKLWYHNHDVYEANKLKKYSLSWFASKAETKILKRASLFTLPAIERKKYFNLSEFKGEFFCIPNYPSNTYAKNYQKIYKPDNEIRIIFQGSIGTGHGIEEILNLMPLNINGKSVKLVLKGFLKETYKNKLQSIIDKRNIHNQVEFIGMTPYQEIANITAGCHIGIAIFSKDDVMNQTLGTASNKIYEYAACGLPILYYDNDHFNQYLGDYEWAVKTDISPQSLETAITKIDSNQTELSILARKEFEENLNFQHHFEPIIDFITKK